MYIKSMVLDGFKSYKNRVEINGFDKEFNAITGLNGSGKSNILDAICFVLGITALGHVRVTSLQELVYKSGQAGKKSASVTITFSNHDKTISPPGYENYDEITVTRQIIIDGKNKYLINGANVTNKRVQDMFCSIQLNVNNPHFLIMQGRITKVLNMKPLEILSMLEEATGTRMFEEKKANALKTIEKKNSRLAEISTLITEEISPKLMKLKKEKAQFVEFQRVERELEHCNKIVVAWKYVSATQESKKTDDKLLSMKNDIAKKNEAIITGKEEIVKIMEKIEELMKIIEAKKNGEMESIEKNLKSLEKSHTKLLAESNSNKSCITAEEKQIEMIKQHILDDEKMLKQKEEELAMDGNKFEELKLKESADSCGVLRAQEKFQKISSGLLENDTGENATLEQQLINAKQLISNSQTEIKQCEMTLNHNKELLKKKQLELKNESRDLNNGKLLEEAEKKLKSIENQLNRINFDENNFEILKKERKNLLNEIASIQSDIDKFESDCPQLKLEYQDPQPNFNRNSVKGIVCLLLNLKNKNSAFALEMAAGGKLYNIVVDTENTSKALLKNGRIQRHVTFIPLNKIKGSRIDDATLQRAQQIGGGKENVQSALSLIEYSDRYDPVMNWIFGHTLICKDLSIASKVAFHKNVNKRCVTLQGDICDPHGTLTGGSTPQSDPILIKIEMYKTLQNLLKQKETKLKDINNQLENLTKLNEKYTVLKQQFDLQNHEITMLKQTVEQTSYHQIKTEVKQLEEEMIQLKNKMDAARKVENENEKRAQKLESQLKNSVNIREKQLKDAENDLKLAQKKYENSKKEWAKYENSAETLSLELSELKKSIDNSKNQLKTIENKITELKSTDEKYQIELNELNIKINELQDQIKHHKNEMLTKNKEIQKLEHEKENIIKQNNDYELFIKESKHQVSSIKNDRQRFNQLINDLVRKNPWINQDKVYFGEPAGIYDFTVNDPEVMTQKLISLENIRDRLSRTVNVRAMNLLAKEEERFAKVLGRREIVKSDKAKILKTIDLLDEKKKAIIQTAWEKVNEDFGSIFGTLLPGASAKLVPTTQNVLDGLEIKVGFTGVWKESLGELSGGQRSLVALSLILAMLLFKPAPVYILDEVDAALDLSHTQNIGTMLKKHFRHSQFIIVSLKDGMFNNANVLYTTKFIDGMSSVTRVQRHN